jgi:hypothetical protein
MAVASMPCTGAQREENCMLLLPQARRNEKNSPADLVVAVGLLISFTAHVSMSDWMRMLFQVKLIRTAGFTILGAPSLSPIAIKG